MGALMQLTIRRAVQDWAAQQAKWWADELLMLRGRDHD
jgi:hypothetical protein